MPPDDIDETLDEITDPNAADETADEGASPADEADSSSASEPEEVDDSPAVAEREKKARTDARIKVAEAAEKKGALERKKRQADRDYRDREERVAAREAQAEEATKRANRLIAELEERSVAIRKGGFDALKAIGVDYGEWTKEEMARTSPDALAQQAIAEAREAKAEIKRRDDIDRQRQMREQAETNVRRFEEFAETNAEEYPDASLLPTKTFRLFADEAAQEFIDQFGRAPTFESLLPRLDRKAKDFHDEQKKKGEKRSRSTTPSNGSTPQAVPGQSASTPANRTLTPAIAGTRVKPPRQMTEEEIDEWCRNELRAGIDADRKRPV